MEKLKEIRDRLFAGGKPTPADKKYIKELAAEHGVEYPKPTCVNCWADIAALICVNLTSYAKEDEAAPDEMPAKHLMREPYRTQGVRWNGRLVRQDILTDGLYNQLIEAGLSYLFVK